MGAPSAVHVVSSPPPSAHAISGAIGAVAAMAMLYPLDQVRAVLQVRNFVCRVCWHCMYQTIGIAIASSPQAVRGF